MGILQNLFGRKNVTVERPDLKFGRFSDSYKEEEKYDAWDKALEKFEAKEYLDSFKLFLNYLKDDRQGNVEFEEKGNQIEFQIYQGSKIIKGSADGEKVSAEAKIAITSDLNIGFLRRLMEHNFGLKYARYALDDANNITMVFDSYMLDGSPYKLYYALKELAINADKQDDILIGEFEEILEQINTGHILDVSDEEKDVKYQFMQNEVQAVFKEMDEGKLNINQYPGGLSYLLLNLAYKLDYLIKPEGSAMETFESIHRIYFSKDGKSSQHKNIAIRKELKKLLERNQLEFKEELYSVRWTFGITAPSSHDQLSSYIDGELSNMDWYMENEYPAVALAIPGYIVGYCLFNYALPVPDKAFLHLYYQIVEHKVFAELGYNYDYVVEGSLNKKAILKEIDQISKYYRKMYPKLIPRTKFLQFDSFQTFAKSYLLMIRDLDLTKSTRKK